MLVGVEDGGLGLLFCFFYVVVYVFVGCGVMYLLGGFIVGGVICDFWVFNFIIL